MDDNGTRPRPIPADFRLQFHVYLDDLLDAYQEGAARASTEFGWDSPESAGEGHIVIEQPRAF